MDALTATATPRLPAAVRCLLALSDVQGRPQLLPLPCWSDGEALWSALSADDAAVAALRAAPDCTAALTGAGMLLRGRVRVFGAHDPVGLLLHAPVLSAVTAMLALRWRRALAAGPRSVIVRVAVTDLQAAPLPPQPPGVAPPLPADVPAEVRRGLAGVREILVAVAPNQVPELVPATWGAGFVLHSGAPMASGPAAVAVEAGDDVVVLSGELNGRSALRPEHAAWWTHGDSGAAVLTRTPGGIDLPD